MKNISTVKLATMVLLLLLCVPSENLFAQRGTTRSGSSEMAKEIVGSLFGKKKDKKDKKKKKDKEAEEDQQEGGTSSSIAKAADDVELVVSGDGINKEEATKVALRSAIEQAFGVFVSANTQILNDELVKDEIATVSSGNIKHYEYLSENTIDGKSFVTVKAIVSIGKLITYSKSKGSEAELAGEKFAMNVKMEMLNEENEKKALENLKKEMSAIIPYIYDYSIKTEEPIRQGNNVLVNASIEVKLNENAKVLHDLFWNTVEGLSATETKPGVMTIGTKYGVTFKEYNLRTDELYPIFNYLNKATFNQFFNYFVMDDLGLRFHDRNSNANSQVDAQGEQISFYYKGGNGGIMATGSLYPILKGYETGTIVSAHSVKLMYTLQEISKVSSIKVEPLRERKRKDVHEQYATKEMLEQRLLIMKSK